MIKWFLILVFCAPLLVVAQPALNQTDANGLKQGKWVKNFESGRKRYEGTFKDDKPVGVFTYYYDKPSGSVSSTLNFESPEKAKATFFHENLNRMGEGLLIKQQKAGEWTFYDGLGRMTSKEQFVNGKREGLSTVFYLDGRVAEEKRFKEGYLHGPFKEFFPSGKLKKEGTYVDGNYDGPITFYYTNEKVKTKGQYQDAVKHGKWMYYQENGAISAQEIWNLGQLEKQRIEPGQEKPESTRPKKIDGPGLHRPDAIRDKP